VGEQVVIACPYGDPSQGVVLGSVYQQSYPAPAASKAIHRTTYPDGSVVEYDVDATRLTVNVGDGSVIVNCATVTVNASEGVELNTPTVHATGDLNVDGNINAQGEVKAGNIGLKGHHHTAQGATAPTTAAQT
jgi:phage baseplate assembly protein V